MSDRLWVLFRPKSIPSEVNMALAKEKRAYLPATIRNREDIIREYIRTKNTEEQLKHLKDSTYEIQMFSRENIDLSKFPMAICQDGCGIELEAMWDCVKGVNEEIELMLEDEGVPIDVSGDDADEVAMDIEGDVADENPNEEDGDSARKARIEKLQTELNELMNKIPPLLPPFTSSGKTASQTTAFGQAHDLIKGGHNGMKAKCSNLDDSLMETKDEARLPIYMELFQALLDYHRIEPSSQRTYFWLVCNGERWMDECFRPSNVIKGYVAAGQGTNDLRTTLDKWPGKLNEADFVFIESVYPRLVQVATAHGTIQPSYWKPIMGKFIYEKHVESLSDEAICVLTLEEIKKPIEERPRNEQDYIVLTNKGYQENQRQLILKKLEAEEAKIEEAIQKKVQAENKKAKDIEQRELRVQIQGEKRKARRHDARAVLKAYMDDYKEHTEATLLPVALPVETWIKMNAGFITAAHEYYVKRYDVTAKETKKQEKIDALRPVLSKVRVDRNAQHTIRPETLDDSDDSDLDFLV